MNLSSEKKLLSSLHKITKNSLALTEKYLNLQDPLQALELKKDYEKRKKALSLFNAFSAKLVANLDQADIYAAKISECICIADNDMQRETIYILSQILDNFNLWRNSVIQFLSENEANFESDIISSIRRLIKQETDFCDLLANTINNT